MPPKNRPLFLKIQNRTPKAPSFQKDDELNSVTTDKANTLNNVF